MSWQIQWQALSSRVGGFLEAVQVFATLFQTTRDEAGISGKYEYINRILLPQAKDVHVAVKGLWETYGKVIPPSATETMKFYSEQLQSAPLTGLAGLLGRATILAAMKSELDYLLADQEAVTIAAVERAFVHLQRTIVADPDQRRRWNTDSNNEPWCEQMGAVHLLWHGIWAFKANAVGERTDLVLNTPIEGAAAESVRASGARLVLTEWKVVRQESHLKAAIQQALTQLRLYSQGSLAGIELRSVRYVIVVSQNYLPMPSDQTIDNFLYRFVNLVTNPPTPSHVSRVRDSESMPSSSGPKGV
ncbi:MAG TPA: hypothetical protein VF789_04880 [Thermoanaerobaculia bacterium]